VIGVFARERGAPSVEVGAFERERSVPPAEVGVIAREREAHEVEVGVFLVGRGVDPCGIGAYTALRNANRRLIRALLATTCAMEAERGAYETRAGVYQDQSGSLDLEQGAIKACDDAILDELDATCALHCARLAERSATVAPICAKRCSLRSLRSVHEPPLETAVALLGTPSRKDLGRHAGSAMGDDSERVRDR
jgi:hypothetical protein